MALLNPLNAMDTTLLELSMKSKPKGVLTPLNDKFSSILVTAVWLKKSMQNDCLDLCRVLNISVASCGSWFHRYQLILSGLMAHSIIEMVQRHLESLEGRLNITGIQQSTSLVRIRISNRGVLVSQSVSPGWWLFVFAGVVVGAYEDYSWGCLGCLRGCAAE